MLKEIYEQPKAVVDTIGAYVNDGKIDFSAVGLSDEDLTDIPVEVDLASEFRYRNPKFAENSMVIVVSQSGETADSLAALRLSKDKGIYVLGIVKVVGSSIARESDYIFYTYAGPEISVATTKAYSTQLIAMYLLAIQGAKVKNRISGERYSGLLAELNTIPEKINKILDDKERI
jgi:glucosamine--fructose-6-phosphate aminotransferase (isomerizing)